MEVDKDDKVLTAEKPPIAERSEQKDVEPGPLSPGEHDLDKRQNPLLRGRRQLNLHEAQTTVCRYETAQNEKRTPRKLPHATMPL